MSDTEVECYPRNKMPDAKGEEHRKKDHIDLLNEDEMMGELPPAGCGILGRYPVLSVLLFAVLGVGVGVGLSYWEPEDPEVKATTLKWLGLVGDMFIRCLKATVLPLVFINVVIAVVEMMALGRASTIGWLTMGLFLFTTVVAAIFGCLSILSFSGFFHEDVFVEKEPAQVVLGCNTENQFITETENGTLMCMDGSTEDANVKFFITDITKTFVKSSTGAKDDISLSDTFYDGIFTKTLTDNIFVAFVEANFAAVVIFAVAFGFALGNILFKRVQGDLSRSAVVCLFKELDGVFLTLINWIIMTTPFAVFSLIVRAIGRQEDLKSAFENVGYLIVATVAAMAAHLFITQMGLLWFFRRENPYNYLHHMIPCQTMAFACASSAATIPMTLRCVRNSGVVPDAIARFVVPLGATINMDGGAIYFPCACIWMAILNGITPTAANYILLIVIATVGSAGTAPVPSASLVLIITAYNTVFNAVGTPNGFEFILAIDWFMDRLRTVMNVTGDTVVSALVTTMSEYDMSEEDSFESPGAAKQLNKNDSSNESETEQQ